MSELFGNVFFWVFGLPMGIGVLAIMVDFFQKMAKLRNKRIELEMKAQAQAGGQLMGWGDSEEIEALRDRVDKLEAELAELKKPIAVQPRTLDPIEEEPPPFEETVSG